MKIKKEKLIAGIIIAFITFFIALLMSLGSQLLVKEVNSMTLALILLLFIIFLGIFFDIIGTAAAAAEIAPFNAMAAKKVPGAAMAVRLIHKADVVANFCNDVVGDIAGTLSGAIGAGIVLNLVGKFAVLDVILTGAVMTSLIAGLTVGGKAIGKSAAISNANQIIFRVSVILTWGGRFRGGETPKNRR